MTPLVCWGAGIKSPCQSSFAEYVYEDEWSEKWGLEKLERIDVEQADIAVLMATLIGAAVPVNSEGVIPLGYLHYNKQFSAETVFANARQLTEQFRIKEERISSTSLPFMFRPFPKISRTEMTEKRAKIDHLIKEKHHQLAIELSKQLIDVTKEGIRYYHTYHRLILYLVISCGFLGWMACIILIILDVSSRTKPVFSQKPSSGSPYVSVVVGLVTMILLMYQSSPPLYYLYYLLPIVCWTYVWSNRGVGCSSQRRVYFHPMRRSLYPTGFVCSERSTRTHPLQSLE